MNACKAQAFELIYDLYRERPDENVRTFLVQMVDFFTLL